MNNDLISRSELLELAHNHVGGIVDCNDIARFPAVDAELVRHGVWNLETKRLVSCSGCGMLRDIETQTSWEYCPNCGAKMDAEVQDEVQ